jgi:hypothetical protein
MATFLAYKEFIPTEETISGLCIWCKQLKDTNKAHIFSKKIIRNGTSANILKKTVCKDCNSQIGSGIEDYLINVSSGF